MSGARGTYLPDASYASGAPPNLVSACLLTADLPGEAKIDQLFTHPLYRARGLATLEIAAAMNRLTVSGVSSLNVWNREGNDVIKRLLGKMGFRQQRTVVEMSAGT
jgi:predicted GNAT family acetyltransferase